MKAFEFYFNPKFKKDTVLETFCFSPSSRKEENLGNLYLIGELKNVLPKNRELLKNLAEIIKNEYYALPQRESGESLKESLKKANQFLEKEFKKENTAWLGNLNFFVFSLTSDFLTRFSKVGDFKIFLFRQREIFNLGEKTNFNNSATKIFSNVVEGKLAQGDRIVVLGQKLFENLWENRIFRNLKDVRKPKELKKLFKENKESLRKFFGVLLFIFVKKERKKIYLNLPKIPLPSIRLPFIRFSQKILPGNPFLRERIRKGLFSILILIIILLLGYLIFR